jgi:hypothetical protein
VEDQTKLNPFKLGNLATVQRMATYLHHEGLLVKPSVGNVACESGGWG